jgi:hypothetical protein
VAKFKSHYEHGGQFVFYAEIGAQFINGEYETTDKAQIEYLRGRPDIEEVKETHSKKKAEKPEEV